MADVKLLEDYNSAINRIYESENLNCLRGLKLNFEHHGVQVFASFYNLINGVKNIEEKDFTSIIDDLIFCSDEIMYFTATALLYKPYLTNPLDNGVWQGQRMIYPKYQNLADKRYNMFCDIAFEKLYNYWDRIGDLIEKFFPGRLGSRAVAFHSIIDKIKGEINNSEGFKWLLEFKEGDFSNFNKKRKQIVHYSTSNTDEMQHHLNSSDNPVELKKAQEEKLNITEELKKQMDLSILGLIKTIDFLNEIKESQLTN